MLDQHKTNLKDNTLTLFNDEGKYFIRNLQLFLKIEVFTILKKFCMCISKVVSNII